MPKIVDAGQKRREILAAAAVVFSRQGYRGTNLQRVAAQAGIGKSSIYHYFRTRQALFEALVRELLLREEALFDQVARSPGPPLQRLSNILDAVMEMFSQWSQAGPLVVDFVREAAGRRALRRTIRQARDALARIIAEGQKRKLFRPDKPELAAMLIVAFLDGLLLQEIIEPGSVSSTERRLVRDALTRLVVRQDRT